MRQPCLQLKDTYLQPKDMYLQPKDREYPGGFQLFVRTLTLLSPAFLFFALRHK